MKYILFALLTSLIGCSSLEKSKKEVFSQCEELHAYFGKKEKVKWAMVDENGNIGCL